MREWLSGRASPCQGERREFESRLPLQMIKDANLRLLSHNLIWRHSQVVRQSSAKALFPSSNLGGASKDPYTIVCGFFYLIKYVKVHFLEKSWWNYLQNLKPVL